MGDLGTPRNSGLIFYYVNWLARFLCYRFVGMTDMYSPCHVIVHVKLQLSSTNSLCDKPRTDGHSETIRVTFGLLNIKKGARLHWVKFNFMSPEISNMLKNLTKEMKRKRHSSVKLELCRRVFKRYATEFHSGPSLVLTRICGHLKVQCEL